MAKDKKPDTIKIEVHEDKPNLLWPECVAALRCLPAGASNFVEWGYRHPLGMYNVSVENLPRRFGAVLDVLDELRAISLATNPAIADVTTRLLDSQQSLLYAMLEHLEDCYHIACAFYPKAAYSKEPALREFQTALHPHRDPLGKIVNAIKHNQARLGFFQASNRMVRIPGYSVQVPIEPGVIGPAVEIHGNVGKDRVAAISFNHDLRFLFCTIFAASRYLTRLVGRIIHERSSLAVCQSKGTGLSDARPTATDETAVCNWAFVLAERIEKLLPFFYPQEVGRSVPMVTAAHNVPFPMREQHKRQINIEFSDRLTPLTFGQLPGGPVTVSAMFQGDGVTRSFRVP